MKEFRKRFGSKGFTLLEILVAGSIMLMLCYFFLKVGISVLNTWERAKERVNKMGDLVLALDLLEKDLESSLPYYWRYGLDEKRWRFCFYSFGKMDCPNALVYEVGEGGLYRWVKNTGTRYSVSDGVKEIAVLTGEVQSSANLVAQDVKGLKVKFLYRNLKGKMEWTEKLPFIGTAMGVEIEVRGSKNESKRRRVVLVGVSRL